MDPKKQQNLTPELKQIYDRVMNTQVAKPQGASQIPSQPQTAAPQTSIPPQDASPASPPPPASAPTPSAPQTQAPAVPASPASFLSSMPARPITDTAKSFTFSGKVDEKTDEKTPHAPAQEQKASGKKISGKMIGFLAVGLVVIWSLFWVKFFGLI